jgi:hypothetical protein
VVTAWISWVLPSSSTSALSTSRSSLRILGRGSGRHSVEKLEIGSWFQGRVAISRSYLLETVDWCQWEWDGSSDDLEKADVSVS